jgi:serine O-acetyltransferase
LKLLDHTRESLLAYLTAQGAHIVPDGREAEFRKACDAHLDEALERMHRCINACAPWRPDQFNVLQSSQHTIFLYYLSNTMYRRSGETAAATRLFLMNKTFNGIDLFYEIAMPEVFYIGHSVGIVLAKATYGNYLVLYQNSTVGRHKDQIPVIGDRVVLYPNTAVIGRSVIGADSVLSQGVSAVNKTVPEGVIAFRGAGGSDLAFQPRPDDLLKEYFRL